MVVSSAAFASWWRVRALLRRRTCKVGESPSLAVPDCERAVLRGGIAVGGDDLHRAAQRASALPTVEFLRAAAGLTATSEPGDVAGSLRAVFDRAIALNARSLIMLMALSFAPVVWVLFRRSSRPFVAHVVFALHLYAFLLLLFCVATAVPAVDLSFGAPALPTPWTSSFPLPCCWPAPCTSFSPSERSTVRTVPFECSKLEPSP